jgi:hypothetical protein
VHRTFQLKNQLATTDAQALERAFIARLNLLDPHPSAVKNLPSY